MNRKNRLTSTNETRTIVQRSKKMDATTKSLLRQLRQLEFESYHVRDKIKAIQTALRLAGVRPETNSSQLWASDTHESNYRVTQPFAEIPLTEACEQVLKDYRDKWLTKSQVEYLITLGGYKSSAKDAKNSVDVTLRRLAAEGKCDVTRVRGSHGNRYRWIAPEVKEKRA